MEVPHQYFHHCLHQCLMNENSNPYKRLIYQSLRIHHLHKVNLRILYFKVFKSIKFYYINDKIYIEKLTFTGNALIIIDFLAEIRFILMNFW